MQRYDDDAVVDDGPYDVHGDGVNGGGASGAGGDSGWSGAGRDKLRNMGAQLGNLGNKINVKDLGNQLKENPERSALVGALVVIAVLCCVCFTIICCLLLCGVVGWIVAGSYITATTASSDTVARVFDGMI